MYTIANRIIIRRGVGMGAISKEKRPEKGHKNTGDEAFPRSMSYFEVYGAIR